MTLFEIFLENFGEWRVASECRISELPFLSDIEGFLARVDTCVSELKAEISDLKRKQSSLTACDRCGGTAHQVVQLVGGYTTRLCTLCRTNWHRYAKTTPEMLELSLKQARYDWAIRRGSEDMVLDRHIEMENLRDKLFNLADEWLHSKTENKEGRQA